jgi:hypothetical protein
VITTGISKETARRIIYVKPIESTRLIFNLDWKKFTTGDRINARMTARIRGGITCLNRKYMNKIAKAG